MTAIRYAYSRSKGTMGWILAAMVLALPWLSMSGALEAFLELSGVKGESTHPVHKEKIDILSWSWGGTNSGSTHMGGGGSRANFQDLSLTKWIDKSTPILMARMATGELFATGKLYIHKPTAKGGVDLLTFEMKDILVTSQSMGGSGGEDRLTENISLNFAEFTLTYQQTATDGSTVGAPVSTSWDIVTGTVP
jgi:type VI secretion system secreted protein Hcp